MLTTVARGGIASALFLLSFLPLTASADGFFQGFKVRILEARFVEAPSCSITISNVGGDGYFRTGTLGWHAERATSAHVTEFGAVPVNDMRTISMMYPREYILTVTGPGGTTRCSTTGEMSGFGTVSAHYYPDDMGPGFVALSQLPHTGYNSMLYYVAMLLLVFAGVGLFTYHQESRIAFENVARVAALPIRSVLRRK